jgi:hypothetical protein
MNLIHSRMTMEIRLLPELPALLREQQGVTPGGTATVSETVSKPASASTIRHYCSKLR